MRSPKLSLTAPDEHSLRQSRDLAGGYKRVELRVEGAVNILHGVGNGAPLLNYLSETLREIFGCLAHNLTEKILPTVFITTAASLSP